VRIFAGSVRRRETIAGQLQGQSIANRLEFLPLPLLARIAGRGA